MPTQLKFQWALTESSTLSSFKTMESLDKINLLNFDTLEHRNSRYVLTSPMSLRACSNLGIRVSQVE